MMKLILLKDTKKLGRVDDIINVADGYALNYLIPQKIAARATEDNIKQLNNRQENNRKVDTQRRVEAMLLKEKIEKETWFVDVSYDKVTMKIHGSITEKSIIKKIKEKYTEANIESRSFVDFPKTTLAQIYTAKVRLYKDVIATIMFGVEI